MDSRVASSYIFPVAQLTFREFADLARLRGWSPEFLGRRFRGTIDDPQGFFTRVLACRYQNEYRGNVIIPYRSVIDFYHREREVEAEPQLRLF